MELLKISELWPDLNVTVKAGDLLTMVQTCIQGAREQLEQLVTAANTETYHSRTKVAEMLGVDKSTLSRWHKRNYLVPIKIGSKVRYKMSDIKSLLGERRAK